ncbi:hypothetical protein A361_03300 [Cytobacillus oceanisediminis 2691]|jgi:hypothetical protein|uniref:Uncharacterized protein n=2 Tax=Cytobacillus oceanisediminis TaxID=665099 RepID=A0A160M861_9BACI|nr:hypothetical protein A361_03300 [Cytobacillus oceanisediminis 2691]OHX48088.1 hypothetical protein BBV17_18450 [Cytobacillus oceanisediminis]
MIYIRVSIIGESVIFLSIKQSFDCFMELGWHHDHTRPYVWEECGLFFITKNQEELKWKQKK